MAGQRGKGWSAATRWMGRRRPSAPRGVQDVLDWLRADPPATEVLFGRAHDEPPEPPAWAPGQGSCQLSGGTRGMVTLRGLGAAELRAALHFAGSPPAEFRGDPAGAHLLFLDAAGLPLPCDGEIRLDTEVVGFSAVLGFRLRA